MGSWHIPYGFVTHDIHDTHLSHVHTACRVTYIIPCVAAIKSSTHCNSRPICYVFVTHKTWVRDTCRVTYIIPCVAAIKSSTYFRSSNMCIYTHTHTHTHICAYWSSKRYVDDLTTCRICHVSQIQRLCVMNPHGMCHCVTNPMGQRTAALYVVCRWQTTCRVCYVSRTHMVCVTNPMDLHSAEF